MWTSFRTHISVFTFTSTLRRGPLLSTEPGQLGMTDRTERLQRVGAALRGSDKGGESEREPLHAAQAAFHFATTNSHCL